MKKKTIAKNEGWTTAEYILGLIVLATVVTGVVSALGGRLQGLVAKLPF